MPEKCEISWDIDMAIITEYPFDLPMHWYGYLQLKEHEANRVRVYQNIYFYIKKPIKIGNNNKKELDAVRLKLLKKVISYANRELGGRRSYGGINGDNKHIMFRNIKNGDIINSREYMNIYRKNGNQIPAEYEFMGFKEPLYVPDFL